MFGKIRFIALLFCLTSMAALVDAQHREDQPLTDELYSLVKQRTELIHQSIATSKNEWAGTYVAGDHHPTIFIWAPQQGFLVTSSNHTFSPSWVNYGKAAIVGEMMILEPTLTKDNQYAHRIGSQFRLVKWGEQHFLIEPDELKRFAYAVHSRAYSEIVNYFFKWEGRDKTRRGLPNLPPEFARYLTMPPIVTTITAAEKEDGPGQEVTIAAGQRNNVIEGMVFYYRPRRGSQFSIRVTEVSRTTSKAQVESRATTSSSTEIKIRPGLKLTSRIPTGFIEPG